MNTQEAIKILRNTAWLGTNEDREKTEQAIEVVAEALEHEQNCVKCQHYYETEDDTGVHSQCKATCSDNAQVKELKPCRECKYCRVAGDVKHYYYCDIWDAVVSESGYCNYGEKHE